MCHVHINTFSFEFRSAIYGQLTVSLCLSLFKSLSWQGVLDTTLCDKVCLWLATGRWFSPGTLASSTTKTGRHDIAEILLKVAVKQQKSNQSIGGVMVSVVASSALDCGFEPRSGQAIDWKIGICCFSTKHAALRRKSKDWLARNQHNVSEWGDMSICGLLFQWASTIKI